MSRALVVGYGALGSRLAKALERDHEVVTVDVRASESQTTRHHTADLRDSQHIQRLVQGLSPDLVFYTAGISAAGCDEDPALGRQLHVAAPSVILRSMTAGRFVYISSFAVYGFDRTSSPNEDCQTDPRGIYATLKAEAESTLLSYATSTDVWVIRPCGLYGDSQGVGSLSQRYLRNRILQLDSGVVKVPPPATNLDEFMHYDNAAQICAAIGRRRRRATPHGRVLNVGTGVRSTGKDLTCALRNLRPDLIEEIELPPNGFGSTAALDVSRMKRLTRTRPMSLTEGLAQMRTDVSRAVSTSGGR